MSPWRLLNSILLLLLGTAAAQGVILRGELGLDSGVHVAVSGGEAAARVPVLVRARVEIDAELGGGPAFRSVLLPAFGGGTGADDPLVNLGLQEAFVHLRSGETDLSAGLERLPLTQMRVVEPLTVEPRLETGEARGPLGLRVQHYSGPWRAGGALLAVTGGDLLPDGPGAVVSLRFESPATTIEGHALWTVRPALGVTVSGSLGSLVAYGEAWLLSDPWAGRGGIGASGYLGEWLWTVEAAWAAPAGKLRSPARPMLAASASRALGLDLAVDATMVASWPRSPLEPSARFTRIDAALALRQESGDASFTLTPALHLADELLAVSLGVSMRSYY